MPTTTALYTEAAVNNSATKSPAFSPSSLGSDSPVPFCSACSSTQACFAFPSKRKKLVWTPPTTAETRTTSRKNSTPRLNIFESVVVLPLKN